MTPLRRYSRFSMETRSSWAPTRFLSEGMRSRPSTWASTMTRSMGYAEDEGIDRGCGEKDLSGSRGRWWCWLGDRSR